MCLCFWLFSLSIIILRFIHLCVCYFLLLSCISLHEYTTICLSIYLLMDFQIGPSVWPLWMKLLWTFVCLYADSAFISLGYILSSNMVVVIWYFFFKKLFSKVVSFDVTTSSVSVPFAPHDFQHLVWSVFLILDN